MTFSAGVSSTVVVVVVAEVYSIASNYVYIHKSAIYTTRKCQLVNTCSMIYYRMSPPRPGLGRKFTLSSKGWMDVFFGFFVMLCSQRKNYWYLRRYVVFASSIRWKATQRCPSVPAADLEPKQSNLHMPWLHFCDKRTAALLVFQHLIIGYGNSFEIQ